MKMELHQRSELLDFSSNLFNGNLAPGLWKCSELQDYFQKISIMLPNFKKLHYPLNSLLGAISDKIVNLTNLAILDLAFNHFGGKLTPNLGELSKLKFMTLDFNNLEGPLPQSLMNCTNLVEWRLGSNDLEGDISMLDFSRLTQLTKLDLRMNNFTGMIPVSLYACRSLKAIRLSRNHLEGQIEAEILSLKSLSFFSLAVISHIDQRRGGEFPQQLCRLPRLVYEPIASQGDQYEFELPVLGNGSFCSTLPQKLYFYLATIDLSKNNIVGDTRTDIGQLQLLYMLVLDSNNFSNIIPDQISNLKSLKVLKLSMNHLSGIMPSSLASLNFLKEFKASYNNLKGPIPTGTQLQSFNASAFEGNPDFCGAPLPNKCGPSRCIDADNKNNKDVNNY
ncbi:hypothetical protein PRUPE_4G168800 [Prunus persica]|uniref:Leucine-rich repeat-containing N-terminal plant-type domain-containing protein n=1 Tax=Prunus persica TaxID=3760 RepID=A0A251PLQ9_PRUPE|nr:hypothetical protein PRUPE_4G168800 [Prunus persica]